MLYLSYRNSEKFITLSFCIRRLGRKRLMAVAFEKQSKSEDLYFMMILNPFLISAESSNKTFESVSQALLITRG